MSSSHRVGCFGTFIEGIGYCTREKEILTSNQTPLCQNGKKKIPNKNIARTYLAHGSKWSLLIVVSPKRLQLQESILQEIDYQCRGCAYMFNVGFISSQSKDTSRRLSNYSMVEWCKCYVSIWSTKRQVIRAETLGTAIPTSI